MNNLVTKQVHKRMKERVLATSWSLSGLCVSLHTHLLLLDSLHASHTVASARFLPLRPLPAVPRSPSRAGSRSSFGACCSISFSFPWSPCSFIYFLGAQDICLAPPGAATSPGHPCGPRALRGAGAARTFKGIF